MADVFSNLLYQTVSYCDCTGIISGGVMGQGVPYPVQKGLEKNDSYWLRLAFFLGSQLGF
jgi:hypothetical protein